jgi:putative ATP-dependent endonuclease of OLD family
VVDGAGSGAKTAVLGDSGDINAYDSNSDDMFRWYRYLFLGRSKPNTHLRILGNLEDDAVAAATPEELAALLAYVNKNIFPESEDTSPKAK